MSLATGASSIWAKWSKLAGTVLSAVRPWPSITVFASSLIRAKWYYGVSETTGEYMDRLPSSTCSQKAANGLLYLAVDPRSLASLFYGKLHAFKYNWVSRTLALCRHVATNNLDTQIVWSCGPSRIFLLFVAMLFLPHSILNISFFSVSFILALLLLHLCSAQDSTSKKRSSSQTTISSRSLRSKMTFSFSSPWAIS